MIQARYLARRVRRPIGEKIVIPTPSQPGSVSGSIPLVDVRTGILMPGQYDTHWYNYGESLGFAGLGGMGSGMTVGPTLRGLLPLTNDTQHYPFPWDGWIRKQNRTSANTISSSLYTGDLNIIIGGGSVEVQPYVSNQPGTIAPHRLRHEDKRYKVVEGFPEYTKYPGFEGCEKGKS